MSNAIPNQEAESDESRTGVGSRPFQSLRVWPALALSAGMIGLRFAPRLAEDGGSRYFMIAGFGPLICCLLIVIWWVAGSRAQWQERVFGLLGLLTAFGVAGVLLDSSMYGPGIMFVLVPLGLLAFVVGAACLREKRPRRRTGISVALAAIACSFVVLLSNDGMTGDYSLNLHWRWTPTAEEKMLASRRAASASKAGGEKAVELGSMTPDLEWTGFRGADRSARYSGPAIRTDWNASPPEPIWKIAVGPSWGSFAVAGGRLFTQEQRGPYESVVCYDADSGSELWVHEIEARFDDPMGGPGPRGTPTFSDGMLFATGGTGIVVRLNPATGDLVWKQEMQEVADRKPPTWGFSGSPLVAAGALVVHAGGGEDRGLLAFDVESGEMKWSAPSGDHSYSSPQLSRILGEDMIVMLSNVGVDLVAPTTGKVLLKYEWAIRNYRALQPKVVGEDTILIPSGMRKGTRAIRVQAVDGRYSAEELWTSRHMKPDFSDFVVYDGHAYGFDGGIFASIDLADGKRNWKGGRYGKGQVVLLEDSQALLVVSEKGEVALVRAEPAEFVEIGRFPALEGKTWNHPVFVGDRLFVRNAQEAACYRFALAAPAATDLAAAPEA